MKLIYHQPNEKYLRSPFDTAIESVVKGESIKIACPYIGLEYFENSIAGQCKDFQLLTDINELILSCRNILSVEEWLNFIEKYKKQIKHFSGLHSKVIISEQKAFFGSANLTKSGITERNELSAVIDNKDDIKSLNSWFDTWWKLSNNLDTEDLRIKIDVYKKELKAQVKNKIVFIKSQHIIKSTYDINKTNKNEHIEGNKNEEYLVNFLRHWENKDWLISYFNLAKYIIEKYNITVSDQRLCISFREEKYRIPITIGQRYILAPHHRKDNSIGLIMSMDYDQKNAEKEGSFLTTYFTKNNKRDAAWVHYDKGTESFSFNGITLQQWECAVKKELDRSTISSFRKYNQPVIYKFIMEDDFREKILSELF